MYLLYVCSDQEAGGAEGGSANKDWALVHASLGVGHEGHAVDLSVGLNLRVNIVGQESLQKVVEFVFAQFLHRLRKCSVHPVGVGSAVSESVVVDDPQSVFECLGIHQWVQGIFRRVEDAQAGSVRTSVLLLGKVLVELSRSELLIALGLLVLSRFQLAFKILNISLMRITSIRNTYHVFYFN